MRRTESLRRVKARLTGNRLYSAVGAHVQICLNIKRMFGAHVDKGQASRLSENGNVLTRRMRCKQ